MNPKKGNAVSIWNNQSFNVAGGMAEKAVPIKGPLLWLTEEISAEFEGLTLLRVGLQGSVQLQTLSSSDSGNKGDIEFSFSLDGAAGIKVDITSQYPDP